MDENKKIDTAFKLLDNVQSLIKFADTKINVLLIISGVTTTFILTNFQDLCDLSGFSKFILGLFFLTFISFVILSILTISPRTDKHSGNSPAKTIYFKHISKRIEVKDFIDDFNKLTPKSLTTDLLYQVFENSKIADKKFTFYNNSLIALQVQIFFFLVLIGLKYFS
ncbi:MAG: Pycsar system effector family protein [Flavobacteriales bacterium]